MTEPDPVGPRPSTGTVLTPRATRRLLVIVGAICVVAAVATLIFSSSGSSTGTKTPVTPAATVPTLPTTTPSGAASSSAP